MTTSRQNRTRAALGHARPVAKLVQRPGTVLSWSAFCDESPAGVRCGVCGDKIKNDDVLRLSPETGDTHAYYRHPTCTECDTCGRSWVDCFCETAK